MNVKIANLQSQIAELQLLKGILNGSLIRVTVASNDIGDLVLKLKDHIDRLESLRVEEVNKEFT